MKKPLETPSLSLNITGINLAAGRWECVQAWNNAYNESTLIIHSHDKTEFKKLMGLFYKNAPYLRVAHVAL